MKEKSLFSLYFLFFLIAALQTEKQTFGQTAAVYIDFAKPARVKSMSGFLHSMDAVKPPDSLVLPLKPKQWRTSETDPAVYDRIKKSGARTQIVLSDLWGYPGLNSDREWAYQSYAGFEEFVRQIARRHKSNEIIWDIWNEPDDPRLPFWKGTFEQFCETYRRAYKILRQELGPDVMIGGPSFSRYDKNLLTKFLDFCRVNNCEVNFLSWHELDERAITSIPERLDEAHKLFLENPKYSRLKIKEIQINEIIGGDAQYNPGVILGYFYYLEKGKADGASKACWENLLQQSNCYNNSLDGLISKDFRPRAAWWTYKIYADGAESRVESAATNPKVAALGSARSDKPDKAQVLIAFFKESGREPPTINVSIKLNNLNNLPFIAGAEKVRVKIEKIPDTGEKALESPVFVSEKDFIMSNNSLQIVLDKISVNEVFLVTVGK